ncbi:DNA topoisomerase 1 [Caerostris extrusa]|uniref:DNA topoisomerase 1 n=1 Tax=Caerostris extrusa TaxID=172846 RepID=A0AAV4XJI1_CAEEX|nr:DNA topoisomerase 1 [Caerostris extrusa]
MKLSKKAEEVAGLYAMMLGYSCASRARFKNNFFKDWTEEIQRENENLTKKYGYCTLDGHKQEVVNFKIEPPALFKGRGNHPKMGMLKKSVSKL